MDQFRKQLPLTGPKHFYNKVLVFSVAMLIGGSNSAFAHAQTDHSSAENQSALLSKPGDRPLAIDFTDDPVLALANAFVDPTQFRSFVIAAVHASPVETEARALERAAKARVAVARAGYLPTIDMGLSAFTTLERNFSDDPDNFIERSRPRERVDFTFSIAQPLVDFGATGGRVAAAAARLRAAGFDREARTSEVAGELIWAWTEVFAYHALARLTDEYLQDLDVADRAIEARIARGIAPAGDRVRVAAMRAQAQVDLAQLSQLLANARSRFAQISNAPPPANLLRPPLLSDTALRYEAAILAADTAPQVESAKARAEASRRLARAAEAEKYPRLTARLDHGRYGIYEPGRDDYDTRATLNLNWRILGGGTWAQARAAQADADAAQAVADRIASEARRDAILALNDVEATQAQVRALEAAYRAARQSRDIVAAQFDTARATLFDLTQAQGAYVAAGSAYIRALADLDRARYILLLRTGGLLDALGLAEEATAP